MPLVPTDGGNEVPDAAIKALEQGTEAPIEKKTESESELSEKTPAVPLKIEDKGNGVPFHENPEVQLYIERQVQKRVGEGNKEWETRLGRLEERLTHPKPAESTATWQPKTETDKIAMRTIITQAKKEMLDELKQADQSQREETEKADREFSDWFGELRTLGQLKTDEDELSLARLIVEYKIEDKQIALKLWNTIQSKSEEGKEAGKEEGIKKAQEARVGSGRKVGEPGDKPRTYQERRLQDNTFSEIVDREVSRLNTN